MITLNKNVYNIIQKIENEIKSSPSLPFKKNKAICDRRKLLDFISKLKKVLQEHEDKLAEQNRIFQKRLKEELEKELNSQEFMKKAHMEAKEIINQAKREASRIIDEANQVSIKTREWAGNLSIKILNTLESELGKVLQKVRENKTKIMEQINKLSSSPPPTLARKREIHEGNSTAKTSTSSTSTREIQARELTKLRR